VLLDGIHRAADGDSPFSPEVLRRLARRAVTTGTAPIAASDGAAAATRLQALTPREREVLALIGNGLSNTEIGDRMHLGVTTVKTHVSGLMAKTRSPHRVRQRMCAHRSGPAVAGHGYQDQAGHVRSIRVPSPGWLVILASPSTSAIRWRTERCSP